MDLKCVKVQKRLAGYLDKELPAGECRGIERHLQNCAACTLEKEMLQQAWALLDNNACELVSPAFESGVWQRIRSAAEKKNIPLFPAVFGLMPAAAAFVLILGTVSGIFVGNQLHRRASVLPGDAVGAATARQEIFIGLDSFDDLPPDSPGGALLVLCNANS